MSPLNQGGHSTEQKQHGAFLGHPHPHATNNTSPGTKVYGRVCVPRLILICALLFIESHLIVFVGTGLAFWEVLSSFGTVPSARDAAKTCRRTIVS